MQIDWSRKALRELDIVIERCEEEFGTRVALRFYLTITDFEVCLSDNPSLGFPEPLLAERSRNYRSLLIHKHFKLVYYIAKDAIKIADLWDTRRDPDKLKKRIKK